MSASSSLGRALDCFFHITVHHSFQNCRSISNYVLLDLGDLLFGTDTKGEEIVVEIVAAILLASIIQDLVMSYSGRARLR